MTHPDIEILREYGPFAEAGPVHGLTFDGRHVWFASDGQLNALDPDSGRIVRVIEVAADAGTAFDGTHLYQIAENRIQKIDPDSGTVLSEITLPASGCHSGLAWAEGSLWVGQHRDSRILQVDPASGRILRTIACSRYVTGVSWVDGELWHGTWDEQGSDLRRVDPATGALLAVLPVPADMTVSGLEGDGAGRFFCGGGDSGRVRAVRKP